jgi:intraflagellar transport protein 46
LYRDLPVSAEIKDLFKYIDKYLNISLVLFPFKLFFIFRFQPQDIVLETKLKPFIPEYVPAIGDIDAFLKV